MGMTECYVALSEDEYVQLALRLVDSYGTGTPTFRQKIESQIASRSSMLYESPTVVMEWERFLLHALANDRPTRTLPKEVSEAAPWTEEQEERASKGYRAFVNLADLLHNQFSHDHEELAGAIPL
jgi:hypothetical protein